MFKSKSYCQSGYYAAGCQYYDVVDSNSWSGVYPDINSCNADNFYSENSEVISIKS